MALPIGNFGFVQQICGFKSRSNQHAFGKAPDGTQGIGAVGAFAQLTALIFHIRVVVGVIPGVGNGHAGKGFVFQIFKPRVQHGNGDSFGSVAHVMQFNDINLVQLIKRWPIFQLCAGGRTRFLPLTGCNGVHFHRLRYRKAQYRLNAPNKRQFQQRFNLGRRNPGGYTIYPAGCHHHRFHPFPNLIQIGRIDGKVAFIHQRTAAPVHLAPPSGHGIQLPLQGA